MILLSVLALLLSVGSSTSSANENERTSEYAWEWSLGDGNTETAPDLSALFSSVDEQEKLIAELNSQDESESTEKQREDAKGHTSETQSSAYPTAVLGRGVENRRTGTILILGCPDAPILNSAGKTVCERVQFFEIQKDGSSHTIGQTMRLGVDFDSQKDFSKFLKQKLKSLKKNRQLGGSRSGFMPITRGWYGNPTIPGSTKLLLGAVNVGIPLIAISGGAPILGALAIGLAFPVGFDLALTPFILLKNAFQGNYFVKSKMMDVAYSLENRRPEDWQFRPKKIGNRAYKRFAHIASAKIKRVIKVQDTVVRPLTKRDRFGNIETSGTNECHVRHFDGEYEIIKPCKDIIIISKNAGREEF